MKIPLGRRDDLVARDAARFDARAMQEQAARGFHRRHALARVRRESLDPARAAAGRANAGKRAEQERQFDEPCHHSRRHGIAPARPQRRDERMRLRACERTRFGRCAIPLRRPLEGRRRAHCRQYRGNERIAPRHRHQRDVARAERWRGGDQLAQQRGRKGGHAPRPAVERIDVVAVEPGGGCFAIDVEQGDVGERRREPGGRARAGGRAGGDLPARRSNGRRLADTSHCFRPVDQDAPEVFGNRLQHDRQFASRDCVGHGLDTLCRFDRRSRGGTLSTAADRVEQRHHRRRFGAGLATQHAARREGARRPDADVAYAQSVPGEPHDDVTLEGHDRPRSARAGNRASTAGRPGCP